jgi:DNA-binding NarL/FixJ family response regulator
MCAEGRPLKEIAGRLDLSEKTIQFHRCNIMETFNLKSNADLVLFAIKEGLVSLDPTPQKQNPLS